MFNENQIIETKWTNKNRDWYIERGYTYTNINEVLYVKAKDLPRGSKIKIKQICDCCGKEFYIQYNNFLKAVNNGLCGECSHRKTAQNKMVNNSIHAINKAREKCKENGYNLITTDKEYNGISNKIKFECPKHGVQEMILSNLLCGHKCQKCAREFVANKNRLDKQSITKRIESINGNKLLNPESYIDIFTHNMIIQCKCGNTFTTSIQNYKSTNRCQKCSNKESYGEKTIREYLDANNIEYIQEKRFKDCRDKLELPFDFYLPEHNMCIEYDGEQHYWNVFSKESTELIKAHDIIKNEYCAKNNIILIRIPYFKKKDICSILNEKLQVKDIV